MACAPFIAKVEMGTSASILSSPFTGAIVLLATWPTGIFTLEAYVCYAPGYQQAGRGRTMAAWPAGGRGMAIDTTTTNTLRNALQNEDGRPGQTLSCSIGIMAYNEERNIGRLLTALLA